MIPFWVLVIIGLIETVKAKNRMTKGVRGAHELGISIADRLRR